MSKYIFKREEINNLFDELRRYGIADDYTWGTVREDTDKLKRIAKNRGYKGKMNKKDVSAFLQSQIRDAERDLFLWEELPSYDPEYMIYDDAWRQEQQRIHQPAELPEYDEEFNVFDDAWRQEADRIAHPSHLPEYDEEYVRDWKEEQREASQKGKSTEDECKAICASLTKKELVEIDMIPISRWSNKQYKRFQAALSNYFENILGELELPNHKLVLLIKVIDEAGYNLYLYYTLNTRENYKDVVNSIYDDKYEFLEFIRIPDKDEYFNVSDPSIDKMISWRYIYGIKIEDKEVKKQGRKYKTVNGNFYPYTYPQKLASIKPLKEALAKIQIFDSVKYNIKGYSENCLIYALEQVPSIDKKVIRELKKHIAKEWIQGRKMDELFKEYGLKGKIRKYDDNERKTKQYLVNTGSDFAINLYKEH